MIAINRKAAFWIGVIIIALFALFWANSSPKKNLVTADDLSSTPDYFITKINAKEFDQNGNLIETLTAKKGLHYTQEARTLLETPEVKRTDSTGKWEATGKKGIVDDGSRDILLTNNATAVKHYLESPDITLNADNIHYLDKDQTLTSTGNAELHSTQGETSADTIVTYINSEQVEMTGSVRGKYETTQ